MKIIIKQFIGIFVLLTVLLSSCDNDNTVFTQVTEMVIENTTDQVISLIEGDHWNTTITLWPEEAIDKNEYSYRYTSSNENVFTVNEQGEITATGIGEAALRVWSVNNTDMWTTCIVKVEPRVYPVTSITIPDEYMVHYSGVGRTFNLGLLIKVNPENATEAGITFESSDEMIAVVNEYGEVYTQALGNVDITAKATDGSGVTATCQLHVCNVNYIGFERSQWEVTTSHPYLEDSAVNGSPASLIDDNDNSCLLLVKPGKSVGAITIGVDESVYFIIDMQQSQPFNFFRLTHRTNNTSANLRVNKVSVYGSNDGNDFHEIYKSIPIATNSNEVTIDLPFTVSYRYFKMTYDGWVSSGNTMQISNFDIGLTTFE